MDTISQLFTNGGVVMWPLLGLSIFSLAMILERSLFWSKLSRGQDKILKKVLISYQEDSEMTNVMLKRHQHLPMARIFLAALSLQRSTPEKFRLAGLGFSKRPARIFTLKIRLTASSTRAIGISPLFTCSIVL